MFYDSDYKAVRKVVNVEWSKRSGNLCAQHTLVAQKIASHTARNNVAKTTIYSGEIDLEPYYVNAEMYEMILHCPAPFNDTRVITEL